MQIYLTPQETTVCHLLINNKTVSTFDIQRKGIRNPSQVIRRLIQLGALITKQQKTTVDDYGHSHDRIAFYTYEGWSDE